MDFLKKTYGKILYGIARFLEVLLDGLISLNGIILRVMETFKKLILGVFIGVILVLGTLTLGILFFAPLAIATIIHLFPFFRLMIIILILRYLMEYLDKGLRLLKYSLTEYLYDKAGYFSAGSTRKFTKIRDYGRDYLRIKEEQKRAEEEARKRAEEEARRREEERFRNFYEQQFNFGGYTNFNDFTGQAGGYSPTSSSTFKKEFEDACDVLGLAYNDCSKETVRKAYREMAKKYHPDLNKSPDATEMFQKVNNANEFLTEENINRYRNMN